MCLDSRNLNNLFLFGVCLNTIWKAWAFGLRMCFFHTFFFNLFIFFIKGGHLFTFLLIFPPFHSPYSSVLSNLWKSLNLCLKLYLICSSSTASLSKFIQMDKEEDAFDISAVPGGCGRSLANSYKREVILGTVWICMYHFGLVYSHSVFETCLNICYWCMNNTAIYNLFSGKKTGHCHQERQPACLRGNCLCFGSLQGRNKSQKGPSSSTFSRWGDVLELCSSARQSPLQKSLFQRHDPSRQAQRQAPGGALVFPFEPLNGLR